MDYELVIFKFLVLLYIKTFIKLLQKDMFKTKHINYHLCFRYALETG